jgi:hypothetical protein
METLDQILNDIYAKARQAEALVSSVDAKQALVEIRLAAQCVSLTEKEAQNSKAEKLKG